MVNCTNPHTCTTRQAAAAPQVSFDAEPGRHYSLVMVDPDAPSPDNPVMKEWLHWMVVNMPGGWVWDTVTDMLGRA